MLTSSKDSLSRQDLAWTFEKQIEEKTFGRVRPLRVEMAKDKIIVHGRCPSYYIKQLAIQALLDLVPQASPFHFALDIEVR